MENIGVQSLAIIFVALGLLFWLVTRILVRFAPRMRPVAAEMTPAAKRTDTLSKSKDAIIIVQAGGRVFSVNDQARKILGLAPNEIPNLQRLAKRARPQEDLLGLCAHEGQSRFLLDGRLVIGTSYVLPIQPEQMVVVSLRYPDLSSSRSGETTLPPNTLQTFNELTQAIANNLELKGTLQAIFDSVEKMVPADFMEINLWDDDTQLLKPYRFIGLPGVEHSFSALQERYKIGEGYSGYLAKKLAPLLIADVDGRTDIRPVVDRKSIPMRSYAGVPLMDGEKLIGTLELASMTMEAFTQDDINLLTLLAGHAAIALKNSIQYESEKQRTLEISGLSQLSQALSSVRDPNSLFSKLVESITPLIPVQILGFLLYNENQRTLIGQKPFHGLPSQFLESYRYRVSVQYGSTLEKALLEQDVIITENAMEDPRWEELGFGHVIQASSMRDSVLVPLTSGGRMLGYIQASNHTDGRTVFNPEELRFLTIVTNQAAPIIENALLVQQSRQRAQRAEALRRIGSLASSAANLDEILLYSLQELCHLLQADMTAIFLLDRNLENLKFHTKSFSGQLETISEELSEIRTDTAEYPFTVLGKQHAYISGNLIEEQALIPFYRKLIDFWRLESVLIVPLVVRNEGIGEIWFGSQKGEYFDQSDLQMVSTAAGQLAGVVEQYNLSTQTDESLRRQVDQQRALSRISRELSKSNDLKEIIQLVHDEAIRMTNSECGTLLLFDLNRLPEQEWVMQYFVGDDMPIPVRFTAQEEKALKENHPLNIPDTTGMESNLIHADVSSLLMAPIHYQQKLAGVIVLHSKDRAHFDDDALETVQSLASQAALALGNAYQFENQLQRGALLKRELETLGNLFRISQAVRPDKPLESMLQAIAEAVSTATPFDMVLFSLYDAQENALRRVIGLGIPEDAMAELKAHNQSWRGIQVFLEPEFRIGSAYFIAVDRSPLTPAEVHIMTILPRLEEKKENAWDPDDMLLVPLFDTEGSPIGLISLDAPRDGQRPDWPTFEALELFGMLASMLIENQQKVTRLQTTINELSGQKVSTQRLLDGMQREMPKVQQENVTQLITLQRLERQMERIQVGLEIAEITNRQTDPQTALRTLGNEFRKRFGMAIVLFGEMTKNSTRLTEIVGDIPDGVNPEALFGQKNPLRQVLQEGKVLLVSNLEESGEWKNSGLLNALGAVSLIALPLTLGGDRKAGMLAIGHSPLPGFVQEEDYPIFMQLARQVSVGLQNFFLITETRRRLRELDLLLEFTRKLGILDPVGVLDSLVDTAVQTVPLAGVAWVALWEEKGQALEPKSVRGFADSSSFLGIRFLAPPGDKEPVMAVLLPMRTFLEGMAKRVNEVIFAQDYGLPADDLLRYRKATNGRLPVSSLLVPLRSGERNLGVLVLDNYDVVGAFSEEDEALVVSLAQQTALALENARLFISADRRAAQLQALTRVAGIITSSLKQEDLVTTLLDQMGEILPFQTATLWLRSDNSLSVAAVRGFEDDESRLGIKVNLEDSKLFEDLIATAQVVLVPDVRMDERFPKMVEPENLSWLGVPLIAKSELIGVIVLEKREVDFYTSDHIRAATTYASQAAVSLDNARLFEDSQARAAELDQRSQRLGLLNRLSSELAGSLDVNTILKLAAEQLLNALGARRVSAVLTRERGKEGYLLAAEIPSVEKKTSVIFPPVPLLQRLEETQGIFSTENVSREKDLDPLNQFYFASRKTHSLLIVPLFTGVDLQGWFFIQMDQEYRFTASEIELARTVSNQTAVAAQNARLYAETRSLTEDLERRVEERTVELRREHQNTQTLLRVLTELSSSLDLAQVLQRTLTVLNESMDAEQGLIILSAAKNNIYRTGMNLAEMDTPNSAVNLIARWITKKRVSALVDDFSEDERWNTEIKTDPGFRSVIAVPLMMGEEVLGSLILLHRKPNHFLIEQISLVEVSARQVGVSLNNTELFSLIRDQAESLGGMLREQQMEASRSRGILEAVADGVLVTGADNQITLFNASAERILDLKHEEVVGKSLDQFAGLFGQAAKTWMRTIRKWTEDPASYQVGETYSEQLNLDNGRYISVHLAAVIWSSQFLGTVSTFRDITHEVRVDRLKSEFVANVSHELRTPMTSIKGYAEVMLMGAAGQLLPQQEHFLKVIMSNTERLGVLVNDLLDISRIETGRIVLNYQAIDLPEIAEDVLDDLERRSREENKPMNFQLDVLEKYPEVNGDPERIRQVLYSLVSNGYNYTPANGTVLVKVRFNDDEVQVDVIDNGIGISDEQKPRIFERFFRGEDTLVLETAGTGLGLATSKALVEMHKGKIWFISTGVKGEGSTFSFTLPLRTVEE